MGAGVVVAVLDQVGDVEEPGVQPVRAEQADRLVGYDVQVATALLHPNAADGVDRALDVGDLVAVRQRGDGDDVAGDQRDLVGRRRHVAPHVGAIGRGESRHVEGGREDRERGSSDERGASRAGAG